VNSRNFFIISSSKNWAESVKRYSVNIYNADGCVIEIPQLVREESHSSEERERQHKESREDKIRLLDAFNFISTQLEKHANSVLRNSIAVLDICLYEWKLDALSTNLELQNLLASMLALAFPEIHWIFVMMRKVGDNYAHTFLWMDDLKRLFDKIDSIPSPFFDPCNLRNHIRKNMQDSDKTVEKYLQLHDEGNSASIDEEEAYAYLHGYLAYKLGLRCFLVTTRRIMEQVFNQNDESAETKPDIDLVFEDMFLNFPDREREPHLSDVRERDKKFKHLSTVKNRIFVTVGHKFIPRYRYESNKTYFEELKGKGKKVKKIYKPSGGMYNILEQAGLLKDYWKRQKEEWKAAKPYPETGAEEGGGHSAPGRLLLIAEKLIDRAEKILYETKNAQGCIHGATLALEAKELLGYKTPTTCLEAIALRHQLEVKAECMFYGVGYNIDMKKRFEEIAGEVRAVSRWFHPSVKKKSALNAQLGIITELIEILGDYGQFDEEQDCLKCLRKLNRKWYYLNRPWLSFIRPIHAYIETLVGSLPLFVLAILGWPFALGIFSYIFRESFKIGGNKFQRFSDHLINAFSTFFGLQPTGHPIGTISQILTFLMILGGFMHLGIFISFLYTLIKRK